MNWQIWLKGLVAAVIGGAANAILVYVVDPVHFAEFDKLFKIMAGASLISAASYLKQSPIPKDPPQSGGE